MKITGIILAGGDSSRMGAPKALVQYNGKKLIEWSISIVKDLCDSIIIGSNNRDLKHFGFEIIEDVHENIGPIGGLYATLCASRTKHNIVIPCDTPLITVNIYEKLLLSSSEYDVVIAGLKNNFVEPLIGYYDKSVLKIFEKQIEKKDYKLNNTLKLLNTKVEIFSDKNFFKNINYPSDLE